MSIVVKNGEFVESHSLTDEELMRLFLDMSLHGLPQNSRRAVSDEDVQRALQLFRELVKHVM